MTNAQQRFYAKPPAVQQVIRLYMAHKDLADGVSAADLTFESVDRATDDALDKWDDGLSEGDNEEAMAIQLLEALKKQENGFWRNVMAPDPTTGRLELGIPIKRKK
jgi:hypothetical protein